MNNEFVQAVSGQSCISIPPENVRKPKVFNLSKILNCSP